MLRILAQIFARDAVETDLVNIPISLTQKEIRTLAFLQTQTEAASKSEVVRQAMCYLVQLVSDELLGISLTVQENNRKQKLSAARFRDQPENTVAASIRLRLILHKKSHQRFERLARTMGARDSAEVIRCAIRLYEEIVRASINRAQFWAIMPSGERIRVQFGAFAEA